MSSVGTTSGKGSRRGAADKKAAPRPPSPVTDEEDISTAEDSGLQPGLAGPSGLQPGLAGPSGLQPGLAGPNAGEEEERLKQRIQELEAKVRKYHLKRWNYLSIKYFGVCEAVHYGTPGLERKKFLLHYFDQCSGVRFRLPGFVIQRNRSGSFHHQAKTSRKTWISTLL